MERHCLTLPPMFQSAQLSSVCTGLDLAWHVDNAKL
jgi:hypothetical protein